VRFIHSTLKIIRHVAELPDQSSVAELAGGGITSAAKGDRADMTFLETPPFFPQPAPSVSRSSAQAFSGALLSVDVLFTSCV
jgi:hypothetical protein